MSLFAIRNNNVIDCNHIISGDISNCLYRIPINYKPNFLEDKTVINYSYYNKKILNNIFSKIKPNSSITIGVNKYDRYPIRGGIKIYNVENFVLNIKGILDFGVCEILNGNIYNSTNCALKPKDYPGYSIYPSKSNVKSMINIKNYRNITITSSNRNGKLLGGGDQWYGILNVLYRGDSMHTKPIFINGREGDNDILNMNYIQIYQPAYWTVYMKVNNVNIHDVKIVAQAQKYDKIYNEIIKNKANIKLVNSIQAFNTDGIDIVGDNVHIYNSIIHVGDDCIAVKGGSNWLVENIEASGMGMSIGSVGDAENIIFRNIVMKNTIRAIYIKTNAKNILYDNFTIYNSLIFPIWIGPPYQGFDNSCPLTWPFISTKLTSILSYFISNNLNNIYNLCYPKDLEVDIKLTNIFIYNSYTTPFVVIGNNKYKINIDNINIKNPPNKKFPFSNEFKVYLQNTNVTNYFTNYSSGCILKGDRDSIKPCCRFYYPYKGGHWGYCNDI